MASVLEIAEKHALSTGVAQEYIKMAEETKTCKIYYHPWLSVNSYFVKFGLHKGSPHFNSYEQAVAFCRELGATRIEGPFTANIFRGKMKVSFVPLFMQYQNYLPRPAVMMSSVNREYTRYKYISEIIKRAVGPYAEMGGKVQIVSVTAPSGTSAPSSGGTPSV